jgi:RNA polymerase sigma factor (sigma-70 family)
MDDLEFVRRFASGESQVREQFLKQYSLLIYNYIHLTLSSRGFQADSEYSSDIFQGFLSFILDNGCAKLKAFKAKNGCSLATWLRVLTVNFSRDYLRRIKPQVSLDAGDDEGLCLKDLLVQGSPGADELLADGERLKALEDCVEALNEDDKFLIELNFNQGLSLEEVRGLFRLSRGAMDMKKSRLMNRLRDCFRGKGFKLD